MNRILSAACAAILCALVAAAPAAAEIPSYSGDWPTITGPEAPEEYAYRVDLSPRQELVQLTPTEVGVEYSDGVMSFNLYAGQAHDVDGASVPVTLTMTGADLVTRTIRHREGNPAAGFAPFQYPILEGPGWEGGYRTISVELNEPKPPAAEPPLAPSPPAPTCTVPSLHGFGLVALKKLLRGADCGVGQVRLARGATKGKGKVVKQFKPAGTQLEAGARVAVKLR
ncbi:MAG: PASTA domain-containing protein [Solirubrobacterales bacterium]